MKELKELVESVQWCHFENERCFAMIELCELPEDFRETVRLARQDETVRAAIACTALATAHATGAWRSWAQKEVARYAEAASVAVTTYAIAARIIKNLDALANGPAMGEA